MAFAHQGIGIDEGPAETARQREGKGGAEHRAGPGDGDTPDWAEQYAVGEGDGLGGERH